MPRGGRRPGAGRKPGQLNKRTIEAVKTMGPVGERAIGVLVSAMEDPSAPWSCRIHAASLVANDLTLDELRQLEARRRTASMRLRLNRPHGMKNGAPMAYSVPHAVACNDLGRATPSIRSSLSFRQGQGRQPPAAPAFTKRPRGPSGCVSGRGSRAWIIGHVAQPPKASQTARAVSPPEKFCWPVTRLPSRTANARHSPAWT
jgi:hypothetical protein